MVHELLGGGEGADGRFSLFLDIGVPTVSINSPTNAKNDAFVGIE